MAKFLGLVEGGKGAATSLGHRYIKTSAQSYSGSVQTTLYYHDEKGLMVRIGTSQGSSSCSEKTIYYGTLEGLEKALALVANI